MKQLRQPRSGTIEFPTYANAVAKMATKSVMSPLLWCAIPMFVISMIGAYLMPDMRQPLVTLLICIPAFVGVIYSYFLFSDPDRLQSEEYQLEVRNIEMLRQNGAAPAVIDLQANNHQQPNHFIEANSGDNFDGR